MNACPLRRIVEDAVARLTAHEDPTLVTHLVTFLTGHGGASGRNDNEDVDEGGEEAKRRQKDDSYSTTSLSGGRGVEDAALLSCGFTPVALVAESPHGVGGGGGASRFDHQALFGGGSGVRVSGAESGAAGVGIGEVADMSAFASAFSTIVNTSADADVGKFSSLILSTVREKVSRLVAVVEEAYRHDLASWQVSLGQSAATESLLSALYSSSHQRQSSLAAPPLEESQPPHKDGDDTYPKGSVRSASVVLSGPGVRAVSVGDDNERGLRGGGQRRGHSNASHVSSGGGPKAGITTEIGIHDAIKSLLVGDSANNQFRRTLAARAKKERPILVICRCSSDNLSQAQQRSAIANGGSSGGAGAGGGPSVGANAAIVRRIALAMAQTVTKIILATEAAAAVGKAISFAGVGDEDCCPLISVLVVMSSDSSAMPFIGNMVRSQCLGSMVRSFSDSGRELHQKPHNKLQSASSENASSGGGGSPQTKHYAAKRTSAGDADDGPIPLPVARFLYEVIPHIPVVFCPIGLQRLVGAWFASMRLSDVGSAFLGMVSPHDLLRRYLGVELPQGGGFFDDNADYDDDDDDDDDDDRSDKCEGTPTHLNKVERIRERGRKAPRRACSRAEQFLANAELLQFIFDHCAVTDCLLAQKGHADNDSDAKGETRRREKPTSSLFTESPSLVAAKAFAALYSRVCFGQWDTLSRVSLWTIVPAAEYEGHRDSRQEVQNSVGAAGDGANGEHKVESRSLSARARAAANLDNCHLSSSGALDLQQGSSVSSTPPESFIASPSANKLFRKVSGHILARHFRHTVRFVDIRHITMIADTYPTYFSLLSSPLISFTPELVRNLINKVSIVLGATGSSSSNVGSGGGDGDYTDREKEEALEQSKAATNSYDVLGMANRFLDPSNTSQKRQATAPDGSIMDGRRKEKQQPQMVFNTEFYSSSISDAVRILYVLVCHEMRGGAEAGGHVSADVWVPLSHLCLVCCFGDELRCLRALHHLSLCHVVVVRPNRGDARSKCL